MNTSRMSLPRLSDEERDNMEGLLTYEECKKVLETFQKDKSPGGHGFTIECYQFFFKLLGHHLIASFNDAVVAEELFGINMNIVIVMFPFRSADLLFTCGQRIRT